MEAASAQGMKVAWTQFLVYVLAGGCYGFAGVFISAQQGAGDPLAGNPMLLQMFAAVVVGGTALGGGRGGPTGSIIGAYVLMIVVNILLVFNVSAYYSTIAEGLILLLAVLAGELRRNSRLARQLRSGITRFKAWRSGRLPRQRNRGAHRLTLPLKERSAAAAAMPSFFVRHSETIRYAVPAYVCFLLVVLITQLAIGHALLSWNYHHSPLVISAFLLILALGQGTVILTGGLDLSLPWT